MAAVGYGVGIAGLFEITSWGWAFTSFTFTLDSDLVLSCGWGMPARWPVPARWAMPSGAGSTHGSVTGGNFRHSALSRSGPGLLTLLVGQHYLVDMCGTFHHVEQLLPFGQKTWESKTQINPIKRSSSVPHAGLRRPIFKSVSLWWLSGEA